MEFHELQQIVESNSRAIQAILDAQVEARLEREELREAIIRLENASTQHSDLLQRLTTLNEGVVSLLDSLDEDRPTILGRLSCIENKVSSNVVEWH